MNTVWIGGNLYVFRTLFTVCCNNEDDQSICVFTSRTGIEQERGDAEGQNKGVKIITTLQNSGMTTSISCTNSHMSALINNRSHFSLRCNNAHWDDNKKWYWNRDMRIRDINHRDGEVLVEEFYLHYVSWRYKSHLWLMIPCRLFMISLHTWEAQCVEYNQYLQTMNYF